MEDYIQFSAKTKNEAITKACLELGTSSDQLDIQVISEGSSGFFGIGSKPAVIKVRRIEPVSDMQEIDELVESVKLDAIKEEKKLEKPFYSGCKERICTESSSCRGEEAGEERSCTGGEGIRRSTCKGQQRQRKDLQGISKAKQSLHVRNSQELQRSVSRRKHVRELRSRADR